MSQHLTIGQHHLPSGDVVRLRLPQRADARPLAELGERCDVRVGVLGLLRFDPRERAVLVATAWARGSERILGVGTSALRPGAAPDLLLAEDDGSGELRGLLVAALAQRTAVHARRAA